MLFARNIQIKYIIVCRYIYEHALSKRDGAMIVLPSTLQYELSNNCVGSDSTVRAVIVLAPTLQYELSNNCVGSDSSVRAVIALAPTLQYE